MQQQQEFQWIAKPAARAGRISQEKWDEHQKEICELYERTELGDLMISMKIRHGFGPSKRQYVYKLEQWGVKKYKNPAGASLLASPQPFAPKASIASSSVGQLIAKRQHSSVSLQTRLSDGSGGRPAVPPKKQVKLAEFMATKDPYADLGMAFDTPKQNPDRKGKGKEIVPRGLHSGPDNTVHVYSGSYTGQSKPQPKGKGKEKAPRGLHTHPDDSVNAYLGNHAGPSNARRYWLGDEDEDEDDSDDDSDEPVYEDANPFNDDMNRDWETIITISSTSNYYSDAISEYNLETSSGYATPRGRPEQTALDSSRPIESFSDEELQHMKAAADLLLALKFDRQAFPLYVLLFKRLKQMASPPVADIVAALLACARSATTKSQVDIAQNILQEALSDAATLNSEAAVFVFRMLLADSYTRIKKYPAAVIHVERAWRSALAHPDFFSSLPEEYRALDFLFFHYALRTLGSLEFIAIEGGFSENMYGEKRTLPFETEIHENILRCDPGPFKINDGTLGNECLRSCLHWCATVLEEGVNDSGAWKRFLEGTYNQPWVLGEDLNSLQAHEMSSRQIRNIRRAMTFGLTIHLWQTFQNLRVASAGKWEMLWGEQAENLMGISSAELLETLCQLIIDASLERPFKSTLILQAREGADYLLGLPDRELASSVMDCFSRMAYAGPTLSDRYQEEPETKKSKRPAVNFETFDDKSYRQLTCPYVINLIEDTFCIQLPELHKPDDAKDEEAPAVIGESCRVFVATLASSLKSSDDEMAAFRQLKDRIAGGLSGAKDLVMTAPSAMMRDARTSTSLTSMEALSHMASTLSLLPQQASSTASLIARVSEDMTSRFGGTPMHGFRQRLSG